MRSPLEDPQFQALYSVVGSLGRGGMGEVARIKHRVWEIDLAAKVPLPNAIVSAGGAGHLRREAETWVRLSSHPHVVTCHYVRIFADTPVIFIEFVEGGSLADAIERGLFRGGASTDSLVTRALSIILDVARGLGHAHAAGIVHQDVKPSNVMLDEFGAKITDFGIAAIGRLQNDAATTKPMRARSTMVATAVGMTPLYASPEQLATLRASKRSANRPITRATDIWSLGLSLVETLVGKASWQPGHVDHVLDRADEAWMDVVPLLKRMLSKDPPKRPAALEVAEEISMLLERRGVRRPAPAVAEMRADGLNNRAVSMLDLEARDEARALLREALGIDPCHPEAVFNDTLLAWRAGETSDQGALDRVRQTVSTSNDWQAELLEAWIQIERGDEKGAWSVLDRVAEHAAGEPRATRAVARASRAVRDGVREIGAFRASHGIADALGISADERRIFVGARDGRIGIFDLATGHCEHRLDAHSGYVFGVEASRDGRRIYSASWDGTFAAHDIETEKLSFRKKQPGKLSTLVVSSDEKTVWTGSMSGTFRAWSMGKRSAKQAGDWLSLPNDLSVMCAALTPAGDELVVGGEDSVLRFFDAVTGELRRSIKLSARPYDVAFGMDGGRPIFLVGRGDQQVSLHDLERGDEVGVLRGMQSWVSVVAPSQNGRWVVCSNGLRWSLWDLSNRRCVRTVDAPALITGAIFLSNGDLVTLDWAGSVRRYAIEAPAQAPTMVALPRRSREVAAGRSVVDKAIEEATSALDSGRIEEALSAARKARGAKGFERAPDVLALWQRIAQKTRRTNVRAVWPLDCWGGVKGTSGIALDVERGLLATANAAGKVTLWSLGVDTGPERLRDFEFGEQELAARSLAFSSDGKMLAVGTYQRVHVIDVATGLSRTSDAPKGYCRAVTFGGEQNGRIALLDDHGHAHLLRVDTLERLATVRGPENWVNAVDFVDEDRLITGDYDGHLILWDMSEAGRNGFEPQSWSSEDRKPAPAEACIRDYTGYSRAGQKSVQCLKVRGGRVFYGCADGGLHVIEIETGKRIRSFSGHGTTVSGFDFLGQAHVVTVGFDKMVRIFDLGTGGCLANVTGHTHAVWDVVSVGTDRFLTASDDEQVRRFHVDWELGR